MSEIKVSQMPEANNINDNDLLMILQGGYNKKIPKELLGIPTKAHQINVGSDTDYRVNLLKTKNLFDKNDTSKIFNGNIDNTSATTITPATYTYIVYIPVKPSTSYAITKKICATNNTFKIADTTTIPAQGVAISNIEILGNVQTTTHTTNITAKYMAIAIIQTNITTTTLQEVLDSIQIEEGSTATEYTPFINNQINVDNEKFSDTINVGATEDSRSRVNILKSANIFNMNDTTKFTFRQKGSSPYYQSYAINSYGANWLRVRGIGGNYTEAFIDVTGLKPNTQYSLSYKITENQTSFNPTMILQNAGISDSNGALTIGLSLNNGSSSSSVTQYLTYGNIQLNEGSIALPYLPYDYSSIKVDNEEIYRKALSDYSTNEQRIGTWLGKPLYRKVVVATISSGTTSTEISLGATNISQVYRAEVRFNSVGSGDYVFNSYYSSASDYMRFFIRNNVLQIRLGANSSGFNIVAIVEYTKTTD